MLDPLRLEGSEAVGWPVGDKCLTDDPVPWHRTPEPAVVAGGAIVTHHEVMIGWNGDLIRHIAPVYIPAGPDEVLLRLHPIDHGVPVVDAQPVAGCGDDPLDEVGVRPLARRLRAWLPGVSVDATRLPVLRTHWGMEDDDVTDVRLAEVVGNAVDQNALADVERRLHRLGRNLKRLHRPRLDGEREADRAGDDEDQLEEWTPFVSDQPD